jgi:hypothetical protein
MSHIPGGGPKSKNVVEPRVRIGSGSQSARPAGVTQIGYAVGDHTTNRPGSSGYRGEKLHNPERNPSMSVPFGNEVALNVGKGGCGTGRTIHATGSQGAHGATNPGNPRPPGRGILNNE